MEFMAELVFYAAADDWPSVLEGVFDLGLFRVFENFSEPDSELREFRAPTDIPDEPSQWGLHLALFVIGSGPDPRSTRIDWAQGEPDATFHHYREGWGLIELHRNEEAGPQELRSSSVKHRTERQAVEETSARSQRLGDPAEWNWTAIAGAALRLKWTIRRLAVSRIGSQPVLPHAARFIAQAGLRYEYGMGIHATRAAGIRRR